MEKFQHDPDGYNEVTCSDCGGTECKKQLPFAYNRTWLDAKDMYRDKIAPDARRIAENINKGKDNDFFDIYGDN